MKNRITIPFLLLIAVAFIASSCVESIDPGDDGPIELPGYIGSWTAEFGLITDCNDPAENGEYPTDTNNTLSLNIDGTFNGTFEGLIRGTYVVEDNIITFTLDNEDTLEAEILAEDVSLTITIGPEDNGCVSVVTFTRDED